MYCTVSDLINAMRRLPLVQLTDDEKIGEVNEDRVNAAVMRAEALIDSYCAARYAIPFVDGAVPEVIRSLSISITVFNLYQRNDLDIPDKIRAGYDDAVARLKDISRGVSSLGVTPEPERASEDAPMCNKTASDKIFTPGMLGGF
jgi:phage gp36-like protein